MRDCLLIVTDAVDPHADAVVRECARRGLRVFRLHPREYPATVRIDLRVGASGIEGELATEHHRVRLDEIGYCWMRKPAPPDPPPGLPSEVADYSVEQSRQLLHSVYAALAGRWLVDPFLLQRSGLKTVQLARAAACGLAVPETLVTTSAAAAETFRSECGGRVLTKPVAMPRYGVLVDGRRVLPFSQLWDGEADPDAVAACPAVYQTYLEKALELRCVVIGDRVLSAGVASQDHATRPSDVRTIGLELPFVAHALPPDVEKGLPRLTASFGIAFASADLVLTPRNEYVFLDLNPNGQWLWLEAPPANLPLTSTLVDHFESRLAESAS